MDFKFKSLILLGLLVATLFIGSAYAQNSGEMALASSEGFELIKVDGPEPKYPPQAQLNGQEGWVDLRFTVAPNGQVEHIEIVNAEPRRVFERAALRAASKWVFQAPSDSGLTESISGVYRVTFVAE